MRADLANGGAVILDVLKHVERHDRIERCVRDAAVQNIQFEDRNTHAPAQMRQHARQSIGAGDLGARKRRDHVDERVSEATPDLEERSIMLCVAAKRVDSHLARCNGNAMIIAFERV